jgi:hypothetical protein
MLSFRRQSISYKVGNHNCRGELRSPETVRKLWIGLVTPYFMPAICHF